jgi:uncharacterized membrane protein YdcZ (DUF606 family)
VVGATVVVVVVGQLIIGFVCELHSVQSSCNETKEPGQLVVPVQIDAVSTQ